MNTSETLSFIHSNLNLLSTDVSDNTTIHIRNNTYNLLIHAKGTFGTIFKLSNHENDFALKIKSVQPNVCDREYEMLKICKEQIHENIITITDYFRKDNVEYFLMPFIPMDLRKAFKHLNEKNQRMKYKAAVSIMRQITNGLKHIHSLNIMHRDLKPENILYEPHSKKAIICDFGSAKLYNENKPNITYICTRWYRAPELLLDRNLYTTQCDIWSLGCIFVEFCIQIPLFRNASNSSELLAKQMKLIGNLTTNDIQNMNATCYQNLEIPAMPKVIKKPWSKVLYMKHNGSRVKTSYGATFENMLDDILVFNPRNRLTATTILQTSFFIESLWSDLNVSNQSTANNISRDESLASSGSLWSLPHTCGDIFDREPPNSANDI